jgi:hypothetical protein
LTSQQEELRGKKEYRRDQHDAGNKQEIPPVEQEGAVKQFA